MIRHEVALSRHPVLRSIGRALPSNYYSQEILSSALWNEWSGKVTDRSRFERLHRSVSVRGRHLALPVEEYRALDSFGKANDKWVERAADLGEQAVVDFAGIYFIQEDGCSLEVLLPYAWPFVNRF